MRISYESYKFCITLFADILFGYADNLFFLVLLILFYIMTVIIKYNLSTSLFQSINKNYHIFDFAFPNIVFYFLLSSGLLIFGLSFIFKTFYSYPPFAERLSDVFSWALRSLGFAFS